MEKPKKVTKEISEQMIAIDLGYGDVKVAYMLNAKIHEFKFPTAIVRARENHLELGDAGEDNTFLYNGRRYKVGTDALHEAKHTRDFDFLVEFGALLIFVAIKQAGFNLKEPIKIATGLSILDWGSYDKFVKSLNVIFVDNIKINIAKMAIFAQGQGIYKDAGAVGEKISVVDIGYNTLDYLVFKNGRPSPHDSDATVMGVHNMTERVRSNLTRCHPRTKFSEQFAKECFINGGYSLAGEKYDLTDFVDMEKEEYSKDLISMLQRDYASSYNFADQVVFSGGGAYHLDRDSLPKNAIFSPEPFEYSNVRGYLKLMQEG